MDIITRDELKKSDKGYSFTVYSKGQRIFHIVDKASSLVGDVFDYKIIREFNDKNNNLVKIAKLTPHRCELKKAIGKNHCSVCDCGETLPHLREQKKEISKTLIDLEGLGIDG